MTVAEPAWQSTACNLCSLNCGIEIQVDDGRFARIRGDRDHPSSAGYLCQKASRLDYYQNHAARLTHPLRRRPDGSFERIDWDTAIREVAARLSEIRERHGGHAIAYYGGGGQGNHLGGAYGVPFRAALGTPYVYNSLAQEKTGDFWVNGELFGRQTCHLTEGIEESSYVIVIGANPWQAHGIPRARQVIREISKDPDRTLVVVDPRRTRTAELADVHLQVRPGTDAFLMLAMLGTIVQEGLEDRDFLAARTVGREELLAALHEVPIDAYARRAGIDPKLARTVARDFARADSACTRHDLGIEHSLHSTLNTYLEKLFSILTGNLGVAGGNNLHTQFVPLIGHSKSPEEGGPRTRVTGMREISKFYPPNILPLEVNTDHPERLRALIVDSSNPMQTAADTAAYAEAMKRLELVVAIDVADTETVRCAHYVLPAPSQYEKWEATFFTLSFPTNYFHLRRPIVEPRGDTLPEPEIYRRLLVAMGDLPDRFPWLERIARLHLKAPRLGLFPKALALTLARRPQLRKLASMVLYSSLGRALPDGAASAAVIWGSCHFYARRYAKQMRRAGHADAEALFRAIVESDTAVPISTHTYDEMWQLVRHDRRCSRRSPSSDPSRPSVPTPPSFRSSWRPASAAPTTPTRSSAIPSGGARTPTARCASIPTTRRAWDWRKAAWRCANRAAARSRCASPTTTPSSPAACRCRTATARPPAATATSRARADRASTCSRRRTTAIRSPRRRTTSTCRCGCGRWLCRLRASRVPGRAGAYSSAAASSQPLTRSIRATVDSASSETSRFHGRSKSRMRAVVASARYEAVARLSSITRS